MKLYKSSIVLLILILFTSLSNAATYPDAVENLTATPSLHSVLLDWDDVIDADNYTICQPDPSICMINASDAPTLDGEIDDIFLTIYAQRGIVRTPNPVDSLDIDQIYAIHDGVYLYMAAETIDNDYDSNDDYIEVYWDFNQDGLTNDEDIGFRITEADQITRYRWDTDHWQTYGGSNALHTVSGAGTHNVTYKLFVPLNEFPDNIGGNYTDLVVRRTNTYEATVSAFFPHETAFSTTNVSGWQDMYISNVINETNCTYFYTNSSYYNLTGLQSYSWYRTAVFAVNNSTLGDRACISYVTQDYPTYNISGRVFDEQNNKPVSNALVIITDTFTKSYDITDSGGHYNFYHINNDDYNITAAYEDNPNSSIYITVAGSDLTGHDIYIEITTAIDLAQTNIITATDDSFQLAAIAILIIAGFGFMMVFAGMATGRVSPFAGTVVIAGIIICSFVLILGLYMVSSFAEYLP